MFTFPIHDPHVLLSKIEIRGSKITLTLRTPGYELHGFVLAHPELATLCERQPPIYSLYPEQVDIYLKNKLTSDALSAFLKTLAKPAAAGDLRTFDVFLRDNKAPIKVHSNNYAAGIPFIAEGSIDHCLQQFTQSHAYPEVFEALKEKSTDFLELYSGSDPLNLQTPVAQLQLLDKLKDSVEFYRKNIHQPLQFLHDRSWTEKLLALYQGRNNTATNIDQILQNIMIALENVDQLTAWDQLRAAKLEANQHRYYIPSLNEHLRHMAHDLKAVRIIVEGSWLRQLQRMVPPMIIAPLIGKLLNLSTNNQWLFEGTAVLANLALHKHLDIQQHDAYQAYRLDPQKLTEPQKALVNEGVQSTQNYLPRLRDYNLRLTEERILRNIGKSAQQIGEPKLLSRIQGIAPGGPSG